MKTDRMENIKNSSFRYTFGLAHKTDFVHLAHDGLGKVVRSLWGTLEKNKLRIAHAIVEVMGCELWLKVRKTMVIMLSFPLRSSS